MRKLDISQYICLGVLHIKPTHNFAHKDSPYTRTGWSRTPSFATLGDMKHFINAVSAWTAADHTLQNTRRNNEWQMHNQTRIVKG